MTWDLPILWLECKDLRLVTHKASVCLSWYWILKVGRERKFWHEREMSKSNIVFACGSDTITFAFNLTKRCSFLDTQWLLTCRLALTQLDKEIKLLHKREQHTVYLLDHFIDCEADPCSNLAAVKWFITKRASGIFTQQMFRNHTDDIT